MRNLITVIFVIVVLVFGFWFISRVKPSGILCIELTEINHDAFQNQLFMEEGGSQRWPFYFKDGILVIDKDIIQSIKGEKNIKEYRLFVDRKDIDIQKDAKLFLIHNIVYGGVGRETAFTDYYIFTKFPAKVPFPSLDWSSGKVHLTLDDSIANTLNIRLLEANELLINKAPQNAIDAAYAGVKVTITTNQEEPLSKNTKPLTITQEAFAPVPKGPITEEDFKLETVEYGTIEFSTELKVKKHGLCEVHVE